MTGRLQIAFVWGIAMLGSSAAFAQDIENDVPITAEATTSIVPGKEVDVEQAVGQPAVQQAKPDRVYTDGMLANPEPNAEDLGLASPGQKMTVDVDHPESSTSGPR